MGVKGILFTFDAILGSLILIAAVLILLQATTESEPYTTSHYSQDAVQALGAIKTNEVQDPWVEERILDETITDPTISVLDQIGQFWATNQTILAKNLTRIVAEQMLPENIGFSLVLGSDIIYEKNTTKQTRQRAATQSMITGIQKGASLEGSTGVAYLSGIGSKETSAFAFFGGFIGQGNVSVVLRDLPADINTTNVLDFFIEGEFDDDFDLTVNGDACGSFSGPSTEAARFSLLSCNASLISGNNTIELEFDSLVNGSISGGLVKVLYNTQEFQENIAIDQTVAWLPAVEGVINLYDSFYVPGELTNLTIDLDYWVRDNISLPLFLDIGNTTVWQSNASGDVNITLTNATLGVLLDYSSFDTATVPYRLGFYEGNNSNTTGNVTDVILTTSRAGPMSFVDIPNGVGFSERMEVAKNLSHIFIDIVLNATGNRVGLGSYWASAKLDHSLSTDNESLHDEITGYKVQNPSQAQRDLCKAMEQAEAELLTSNRNRVIMLMTDGDTTKCSNAQAVAIACDDFAADKIRYFTVGFGPEATGSGAVGTMLTDIAACTGGEFAEAENVTALEDIYRDFASKISESSITFDFQRATSANGVESSVKDGSKITIQYTPTFSPPTQYQIPVTLQTDPFSTCTPTVNISNGLQVIDAQITSYSGDFWTKTLLVDNQVVFNLSDWAYNYTNLGDPFTVQIPASLLSAGSHTLDIRLGANASVDETCSLNDTLIYTALVNASTSRTTVLPTTAGCNWNIEFDDGGLLEAQVPISYTGANNCSYNTTAIVYNPEDAYDVATYELLSQLDFDNDGALFINLEAEDLQILVTLVSRVPYLWGPSIARMEVWQ